MLVERVDHLIPRAAWQRAYDEINMFEEELTQSGTLLVKIWMHISREEQLERFKERSKDPTKQWKLTHDDWRNRKNWNGYLAAANEMLKRTSTEAAPWHIVPANNKKVARITVMETVADALEQALEARKRK